MKQTRLLAALLTALLLLGALAGCAPAATEPAATAESIATEAPAEATAAPETAGVSVTDMANREVTLDEPATRVVALSAADCEILYAIGAGDLLVGRGEYCDYPAEVLEIPAVQSGMETNLEQIIALEPQVLIMSVMAQTEDQVAQLEAAGIKVVVSDAQDIAGVYTAIGMLGALTGHDAEAAEVVSGMQATLDSLAARAGELEGKSVYFEVSPLQYGLWTAGQGTFMNEVATLLGLRNVFADVSGWAEISEEQVLQANPDIIVTIAMYFGEGQTPAEEILSRAAWSEVTAVKNGDILNLPDNELSRPGPRLADGAQALFDFVLEAIANDNAA
ncbi:MAG: ABC transporter substrate-binding protein [Clostridiales bacterium]|nr:ABC transporter substrate-binding protein [Clostridiales bacterium]